MRRLLVLVTAVLMVMSIGVMPAVALPPDNDNVDSATLVAGLPFNDAINTVEATTADTDPDCFGQGPTVWYEFTPDANISVEANTFGSDYDTTLSVYSNGDQLACNDDSRDSLQSRVRFNAQADATYLLMVGAFESGTGGNLAFQVVETEPITPLEVDLTVDPVGTHRGGVATVSGTLTCNKPAEVELDTQLRQRAGRVFINGFAFDFVSCDGTVPWELTIQDANGRFAGGRADAEVFAFAFDPEADDFVVRTAERKIRLKGGRRR